MNKLAAIFLCCLVLISLDAQDIIDKEGAIIRSDTSSHNIYLCFTAHDYDEGFDHVLGVLARQKIHASFFLTGDFVRNHKILVKSLVSQGHYVGAHSDQHLLYCDWIKRDSLLHSINTIKADIQHNLKALHDLEIYPIYFMPPFEWYNKKVVEIAATLNQKTINFTSGTRSNADYTTPDMSNYRSSKDILKSIYQYESSNNMNGFHLLIHPGVSPLRKDKLYLHLDTLITYFKEKGYGFERFGVK
jgi:peptidoglycan/xylan/chitin deacetylase (PgdA/CDA1 family)